MGRTRRDFSRKSRRDRSDFSSCFIQLELMACFYLRQRLSKDEIFIEKIARILINNLSLFLALKVICFHSHSEWVLRRRYHTQTIRLHCEPICVISSHHFMLFSITVSQGRAMSPAQSEDSGLAADRGSTYATISIPRQNCQSMGIIFAGKTTNAMLVPSAPHFTLFFHSLPMFSF